MRGNHLMSKKFYSGVTEMLWNEAEVIVAQHSECSKGH